MLDSSKATQASDIPVKIKETDISVEVMCKLANVTPVFKKDARILKNNYRPVSILPILSKLFERLISKQLSEYFESILSKFQCDFRKGYVALSL